MIWDAVVVFRRSTLIGYVIEIVFVSFIGSTMLKIVNITTGLYVTQYLLL